VRARAVDRNVLAIATRAAASIGMLANTRPVSVDRRVRVRHGARASLRGAEECSMSSLKSSRFGRTSGLRALPQFGVRTRISRVWPAARAASALPHSVPCAQSVRQGKFD
jgi:hypothetical protein